MCLINVIFDQIDTEIDEEEVEIIPLLSDIPHVERVMSCSFDSIPLNAQTFVSSGFAVAVRGMELNSI